MSDDTAPAGRSLVDFWAKNRTKLISLALALAGGLAGSVLTYLGAPKPVVEVVVPTIFQQQLAAESATPIDYEGLRYHGHAEGRHDDEPQHLESQAARWPTDRITYSIDYASARGINPPLSDTAIQTAIKQAANWWNENLQIELVEVPAGSAGVHIPIRFERIDGPAGTLAEAYLANGTNSPKPLRFDSSERWTAGAPAANLVSLPTVACHELGHSLGLGHDAANAPAVMRPTYTAAIPREQQQDVSRMIALGYKRREKAPPAPTDVLQIPVQLKVDDVVNGLKGLGYSVTKP